MEQKTNSKKPNFWSTPGGELALSGGALLVFGLAYFLAPARTGYLLSAPGAGLLVWIVTRNLKPEQRMLWASLIITALVERCSEIVSGHYAAAMGLSVYSAGVVQWFALSGATTVFLNGVRGIWKRSAGLARPDSEESATEGL